MIAPIRVAARDASGDHRTERGAQRAAPNVVAAVFDMIKKQDLIKKQGIEAAAPEKLHAY
jgi:hypothetical protein